MVKLWSCFGISYLVLYGNGKWGVQCNQLLFKKKLKVQRTLRNLQHIIMGLRVRHRISQTKPAASLYIVPLPVGTTGAYSCRSLPKGRKLASMIMVNGLLRATGELAVVTARQKTSRNSVFTGAAPAGIGAIGSAPLCHRVILISCCPRTLCSPPIQAP